MKATPVNHSTSSELLVCSPRLSTCFGLVLAATIWTTSLSQPVITIQPKDQFLTRGQNGSFSVSPTGIAPFSYQWLLDGTPTAGATNGLLNVLAAQPAQDGYYSVIVSNVSGSVTSQVAVLKVFVPAPHDFSSIAVRSDGSARLAFEGETTALFGPYYDLYPLEASPNLVDWSPLALLQRTNAALDVLQFVDTGAEHSSQRFYRTPTNQLATPDPQPTGPYSVGTFSMLLTNTLRAPNFKFMVTFWYPAVAQAGVLPAIYVEKQVAANYGYPALFSHSLSNAPLATSVGTCPAVLYDPGLGGHRRENTDKAEDLASWGYVVVGLDTSDTPVSVFSNGTVVHSQDTISGLASLGADIEGRLLDMQFVLNELESLNATDPRLGGRLDLNEIGAFGWSLGGCATAQLCLRDSRCKAGAGLDGGFLETNLVTQPLGVPYLYFRSDGFTNPDPSYYEGFYSDGAILDDRLEAYNGLVTNAYWVKLASTVHGSFADFGLIPDPASVEVIFGMPMSGQVMPVARVSQIVRAHLLSFFNKFLLRKDDHLLDGPSPAYPEVIQSMALTRIDQLLLMRIGPPPNPKWTA